MQPSGFGWRRWVFALIGALGLAGVGAAQDSGESSAEPTPARANDQATYRDWAVECRVGVGTDVQQCFASQSVAVRGASQPLLIARVLRSANDDGDNNGPALTAILSLPRNSFLLPGIEMRIDQRAPVRIGFEACNDSGCHAGFALSDTLLGAMRRGRTAAVRFQSQEGETLELPLSLMGFTAATNDLLAR